MQLQRSEPSAAHDLSSLIECGDRSCAAADPEGLRETARLLALCVSGTARADLADLEQLAMVDLAAARSRWPSLAARVRTLVALPSELQLAHRAW